MKFLIDENMPRNLAADISELGFQAQDVRDLGLRARPDTEVMQMAIELDAILITRDRPRPPPTTRHHPLPNLPSPHDSVPFNSRNQHDRNPPL
jgi:Domain of unknown function (DUF5615)